MWEANWKPGVRVGATIHLYPHRHRHCHYNITFYILGQFYGAYRRPMDAIFSSFLIKKRGWVRIFLIAFPIDSSRDM